METNESANISVQKRPIESNIVAALGSTWSYYVNIRIILQYADDLNREVCSVPKKYFSTNPMHQLYYQICLYLRIVADCQVTNCTVQEILLSNYPEWHGLKRYFDNYTRLLKFRFFYRRIFTFFIGFNQIYDGTDPNAQKIKAKPYNHNVYA
jgi:hypothetical protein